MIRGGIIADDLTGALDAGLQVWRSGARVRVLIPGDAAPALGARFGGPMVLDTESRSIESSAARERVSEAVALLAAGGLPLVYKKIDSTLRGNLGAEIEEVLSAGRFEALLLAPSLPSAGRTVCDGVHRVRGVPLDRTEMARDPRWPVRTSEVVRLATAQAPLAAQSVPLRVVRRQPRELAGELKRAVRRGARLLVADAETEADLGSLAAACRLLGSGVLPCGSAGLLAHLAQTLPGQAVPLHPRQTRAVARRSGPVLVVCGSTSEVSRGQLERAATLGRVAVVRLDAARLSSAGGEAAAEAERAAESVARAVASGAPVILDGSGGGGAEPDGSGAGCPGAREWRSGSILAALAQAVRRVSGLIGGLVLVGGDTAFAVCRAAGSHGIEINGEVEPLVPRGVVLGGALDGLGVVTKAGGLGSPQAVAAAMEALAAG